MALAALATALLWAGCGSDEEAADQAAGEAQSLTTEGAPADLPSGSEQLGRIGFRMQADELCLATQRALSRAELEEFGKPGPDTPPPTRAERQRFVEEVVAPTWRGVAESLLRVPEPEAKTDDFDTWIDAIVAGVRELGEPAAILRDPSIEESALDDAEKAAADLGLRRCSEDSVSVRDYASVYEP